MSIAATATVRSGALRCCFGYLDEIRRALPALLSLRLAEHNDGTLMENNALRKRRRFMFSTDRSLRCAIRFPFKAVEVELAFGTEICLTCCPRQSVSMWRTGACSNLSMQWVGRGKIRRNLSYPTNPIGRFW